MHHSCYSGTLLVLAIVVPLALSSRDGNGRGILAEQTYGLIGEL